MSVFAYYHKEDILAKPWIPYLQVILNDPFLGKRAEESNYTVVPLKDEFLENARLFIFETYCRIHERINMGYKLILLYSRNPFSLFFSFLFFRVQGYICNPSGVRSWSYPWIDDHEHIIIMTIDLLKKMVIYRLGRLFNYLLYTWSTL